MNIKYQYKTGNCKNYHKKSMSYIPVKNYSDILSREAQMNCNEYKYISQMNNTKIPLEE